jgi:hypothetical protein
VYENKQLFNFMLSRIGDVEAEKGLDAPQAFARWFTEMYFQNPHDLFVSDGSGDGKVDLFFHTSSNGDGVQHYILNTKFTETYNAAAPVAFYDEVTRFWQAFANKGNRGSYLNVVQPDLKLRYRKLFDYYDAGRAHLFFVTNHRRNLKQYESVKKCGVELFHLEDVLQFMVDYIEDAMPRTPPLLLTGISTVLSADKHDTEVPTSIVFARLKDFISYMDTDPYDLLFARNVRLTLGNTPVNVEIRDTFSNAPKEFAFSNNGITMLCEDVNHDLGSHEVTILNPRVVNGSQTLHSIRDVENPSESARVMVRVIKISSPSPSDLPNESNRRKDIIRKISVRSNRQNPIKKWNLVSNDDFQHDLARYFRDKKLYYERRDREWTHRKAELKGLGIGRGPNIKRLTQLIASYYWDKKPLGPVAAKRELGQLFDGKPYELIEMTTPELAYQLYVLERIVNDIVGQLSVSKKYVYRMESHMRFTLFALCVKALQTAGANFGTSKMSARLEAEASSPGHQWFSFCNELTQFVRSDYQRAAAAYRKSVGGDLNYANFFKSQNYVGRILARRFPPRIKRNARRILKPA